MNIKILDSWIRDYVKTEASPKEIARLLSLTSVSVERMEKFKDDIIYDIEITTNRPDLMSVIGLARETATVLKQNGINASFKADKLTTPKITEKKAKISFKNDPTLVNRLCAVVMEVQVKDSPQIVKDRLETTDIRSLNNLIDITNYVMRITGHPTHVFDFDRLSTKSLTIRESKAKETIQTLDKKEYILPGGDIIATNDAGEIIDLLGVMGLENSVVTNETKRILFFIDNVEPYHIRKTSMTLGIRTEAAQINEKDLDPELAYTALLQGIKLYGELANGKIISEIIDIYPNKVKKKTVKVSEEQINTVIGVKIPLKKSAEMLTDLGFDVTVKENALLVTPPSVRSKDIEIPEDVIEEIARVYGYHNIPNKLPFSESTKPYHLGKTDFYWEDKIKDMMKYWGFTEVYTYPMVSEVLFEGELKDAIKLQNPLSEDFVYMRRTLIPSLLKVIAENKRHETIKIFEIANVYQKKGKDLPEQIIKFAGVIKKPKANFFEMKGIIEQLFTDLGIGEVTFKPLDEENSGAAVYTQKDFLGTIEILDHQAVEFEFNFETIVKHATLAKVYKPISKYPPIVEDLALIADKTILTGDLINFIQKQHKLIQEVSLLDQYQDTRTFHIVYQSYDKNLTDEEIGEIREHILKALKDKYNAVLKR